MIPLNSLMKGSFANPRFVRIPSLLAIKPDPSRRNNWTKVSAILWYQSTQWVALDGPRWHSSALEVIGPRKRAPIAPGQSRQCTRFGIGGEPVLVPGSRHDHPLQRRHCTERLASVDA